MKIFVGHVTGTKMAKTAEVTVERVVIHPLYKKRFKRDKKYQVHDEIGTKINDVVKFAASKPYSKTKKWKILEVVTAKKGKAK
jgi:small subunit ribosomal protein S17